MSLPPTTPDTPADVVVLPPTTPEQTQALSTTKPSWYLPEDSIVRTTAMHIIAMRIAGMDDSDIAAALQISEKSISPYVYRAAKNGWLDIDNPNDRLKFQVLHKVVDNIVEGLSNPDVNPKTMMPVKTTVALKVAEGMLFNRGGAHEAPPVMQSTIVALRIEMPAGPRQVMREDTTGGIPAYIDVTPAKS